MTPPGETVAAAAAHDMPFAAYELAGMKVVDVGSGGDDLAHELMPDRHGNRNRRASPLIPLINVQIRSADSGVRDTNQNVIDSNRRFGYIFEPQARRILRLHQSLHVCMVNRSLLHVRQIAADSACLRELYRLTG